MLWIYKNRFYIQRNEKCASAYSYFLSGMMLTRPSPPDPSSYNESLPPDPPSVYLDYSPDQLLGVQTQEKPENIQVCFYSPDSNRK
jgi:hypothetical protein